MSVLFLMPQWFAPSELWMHRILEGLEGDVSRIASPEAREPSWRGRIPAVALRRTKPPQPRLTQRIARRLGLPVRLPAGKSPEQILTELVRRDEIDRVLVQYVTMAIEWAPVLTTADKPLFIQCHGWDVSWDMRQHNDPRQRKHPEDYADRARQLAKKATFIANSQTTVRQLRDIGIPDERIKLNYLGTPVPDKPRQRPDKTQGIRILYLGRLIDCKGPDQVLRAFELACEKGLQGELVIAGDGWLRSGCELLRARSRFRDRITLLGAVGPEEGELLRAEADIFTAHNCLGPLTGQEEAFGVSVIEAMAAALPVVTGDSGSLSEIITSGKNGILFEPNDLEAHARALLELASSPNLRQELGQNAWREVRDRFSLDQQHKNLRRILGLGTPAPAMAAGLSTVENETGKLARDTAARIG